MRIRHPWFRFGILKHLTVNPSCGASQCLRAQHWSRYSATVSDSRFLQCAVRYLVVGLPSLPLQDPELLLLLREEVQLASRIPGLTGRVCRLQGAGRGPSSEPTAPKITRTSSNTMGIIEGTHTEKCKKNTMKASPPACFNLSYK